MSTHESRSSSGALFLNEFGIVNISGTDFSSNVYSEALIKSKIWIILNEKLLLESSYCTKYKNTNDTFIDCLQKDHNN